MRILNPAAGIQSLQRILIGFALKLILALDMDFDCN